MARAKRKPFQIILLCKALFCRVRHTDGVACPHTAHRVAGTAAGGAGEQGQIPVVRLGIGGHLLDLGGAQSLHDYLILATAVAELTSCPEIPVKVTLDEYIEISKYYSGPGSSVFINGVLDKLVAALTEEGKIQKTGRGLI